MMYPLVLDLAADDIPVAVTCRVLGFSKQAFYKWRAEPVCDRDYDDAHLINAAVDVHHDAPEFGYRFITDELERRGWTASRNRVNRLCTLQQLCSVHARRRGRHRKPGPPVHDDLVSREFTAAAPDLVWFTDITEHPTREEPDPAPHTIFLTGPAVSGCWPGRRYRAGACGDERSGRGTSGGGEQAERSGRKNGDRRAKITI
ncbi:hypothetical protein GCM10009613_05590 [Pseudonocardia kongjuensis]|uniref:HTH-like domain-containing protein n=1 Tax=Pseudonocardia kongjuensis TaxID=102227 RepID=A0ABN1XJU1_9PSEU